MLSRLWQYRGTQPPRRLPWRSRRRCLPLGLEQLEERTLFAARLFTSIDVPRVIDGTSVVRSQLTIAESFAIRDLDVVLEIQHIFTANVQAALVAPDGARVFLFAGVGGFGQNFDETTLDDEALAPITAGNAPFHGSFRPLGSLAIFDGKDARGTWTLEIANAFPFLDDGLLNDWSLRITDDSVAEIEPNNTPATATPVARLPALLVGVVGTPADSDLFTFTLGKQGRLIVDAVPGAGSALDPEVTLLDGDGRELVRSDDSSPGSRNARVDQHLLPGRYALRVSAQRKSGPDAAGAYRLLADFEASALQTISPTVGDGPVSVALGDVNGDGFADLVVANRLSAEVSVLLGKGDGSFQAQRRFAVGLNLTSVKLGDVNGDGRLDIVTANSGTADVSVLLGNGDGSFQAQRRFAVGAFPRAAALGDVNGDGFADVVTANLYSADVSVLLGNGDGSFQPQRRFAVGYAPSSVTLGDVNGDGFADLVTANRFSADVSVLLGSGNGFFQPERRFAAGFAPTSAALGDVNGDGRLDVVTANVIGADVSVLLGNGDGSFQPQFRFAAGEGPYAVLLGDVNGDGRADIITANGFRDSVSVLLSGGAPFQELRRFPAGDGPYGMVLGDINGDGFADLVTANGLSDDVSVLLSGGDGSFQEQRRLAVGDAPGSVAAADVNGDGIADLITANGFSDDVSILLGNGDGSFQQQDRFAAGDGPVSVVLADVNGDGFADAVTANRYSDDVSVLLGNGQGSFQPQVRFVAGDSPVSVAAGDVNGDGFADLATANGLSDDVSVLLGNGNGSFQPQRRLAAGDFPISVALGDVTGDGLTDLVAANGLTNDVSVLAGNGDGTFQPQRRLAVGPNPFSVALADVNADGVADIFTANRGSTDVSMLLSNEDGSFQPPRRFAAGLVPLSVVLADVNGDDLADLITANGIGDDVSVLLSTGGGSFGEQHRLTVGRGPSAVVTADVNGDSFIDLVAGNALSDDVSVLLGNGDGSFQDRPRFGVGLGPLSVAVADINGDGFTDAVTANRYSNDVSVLLSSAGGSFQVQHRFAVGNGPVSVAVADVNEDGRPDLVAANVITSDVSVLLSNGGGSFQPQRRLAVGLNPNAVALGDVNGDGFIDLVTANNGSADLSVLLGNGDGSFQQPRRFAAGNGPASVVLVDLNGDARLDLVTANLFGADVSVLLNSGDGSFQAQRNFAVGDGPSSVVAGDVDGDGFTDVITANRSDDVSVLLGNGDGSFQEQRRFAAGDRPFSVALGDVNEDGRADLITANDLSVDISVLVGNGDGSFQEQRRFATEHGPFALSLGDVNGDTFTDLVAAQGPSGSNVSVLLGSGDALFLPTSPAQAIDPHHTPHRGDLDRDGVADTVVLTSTGEMLFRRGLQAHANVFAPPLVLNSGRPARDGTLISTPNGMVAATVDIQSDTVSIYSFTSQAANAPGLLFTRVQTVATGRLPQRIAAADLTGDGFDELVITNTLDGTVTIAVQQPDGSFVSLPPAAVGVAPSDIAFADLDGAHGLDVIVSNRSSGDVSVLYNDATHTFTRTARYRAGTSISTLQRFDDLLHPHSLEEPVSIVVGLFNGYVPPGFVGPILPDTRPDLVVVNRGAHRFRLLPGTTGGGFTNPQERLSFSTSVGLAINERPGEAVGGDFDRDDRLDLAILMEDRGEIWIYRGQGDGTFDSEPLTRVPAGNVPTGLTVEDVDGDGIDDFLVGNGFGDILFILGNGDGTFRPFVRADQRVPFAAADLDGDGAVDVVLGDQARDLGLAQLRTGMTFTPGAFQRDGSNGLIGPGDVAVADLDGRFGDDLIFANTGSNNVLVYLRQSDGSYAEQPLSFFSGTSPIALHVADLNSDTRLDLAIANQGSNDVSVLLGAGDPNLFRLGPRLKTGGRGPNAVTSRDLNGVSIDGNGDGILDLLATNGQDGTLSTLPGIGNDQGVGTGFFRDTNVVPVPIAAGPVTSTRIVNGSFGFALGLGGEVFRFNPAPGGTFAAVPLDRSVNAVAVRPAPAGAPLLFTANGDGSVSLLTSEDGQNYIEQNFLLDARVTNPSALEVLEGQDGRFEAYLTNVGELEPIVLTLGFQAELQNFENLVLAPVAILTTRVPDVSLSAASPPPVLETFDVFLVALDALADAQRSDAPDTDVLAPLGEELAGNLLALVGGGDEEAEADAEGAEEVERRPDLQQFVTGLREGLEELGWGVKPATASPRVGSFWQTLVQWLGKYVQEWMRQTSAVPMVEGDQAALPPPTAFDEVGPAEDKAEKVPGDDVEPALPSNDCTAVEVSRPGRWSALFAGALLVAGTFYRRQRSATLSDKDRRGHVRLPRNG